MGQIQFFIPMNFILCVVEVKIAIFKGFLKGEYKAADKQLLAKAIELRLANIYFSLIDMCIYSTVPGSKGKAWLRKHSFQCFWINGKIVT